MAREYSPYACNLYIGCSHICRYCYAPHTLQRTEASYFGVPSPRKNVLYLMNKELFFHVPNKQVLLSFIGDCYCDNTIKEIIMNENLFSGKADAYATARPSYPAAAIDYIRSLAPPHAIYADVGAGTGKFTELLAKAGDRVFAVEPNADMIERLRSAMLPYPNVMIVSASAENTTMPEHSVDVITCAQALHWFDGEMFRAECRRIGKQNALVIAIYNGIPEENSSINHKFATDTFFKNPTGRRFSNPTYHTHETWLKYVTSCSHDPLPSDTNYALHIEQMNEIFGRDSKDECLTLGFVTTVYSEMIDE
jgi:ubiquinone/menaquinone biosynthesis C-methylase UbiE